MKNRIELRRMLSKYESGSLKPPIFYKDGIAAPDEVRGTNDDDIEAIESIFQQEAPQPHNKRLVLPSRQNEIHPSIDETNDYDEFFPKSVFREHQRPKYIVDDIEDTENDPRTNDANEYHRKFIEKARPRDQSGVYTEGGWLFGPSAHIATSSQHRKRKC